MPSAVAAPSAGPPPGGKFEAAPSPGPGPRALRRAGPPGAAVRRRRAGRGRRRRRAAAARREGRRGPRAAGRPASGLTAGARERARFSARSRATVCGTTAKAGATAATRSPASGTSGSGMAGKAGTTSSPPPACSASSHDQRQLQPGDRRRGARARGAAEAGGRPDPLPRVGQVAAGGRGGRRRRLGTLDDLLDLLDDGRAAGVVDLDDRAVVARAVDPDRDVDVGRLLLCDTHIRGSVTVILRLRRRLLGRRRRRRRDGLGFRGGLRQRRVRNGRGGLVEHLLNPLILLRYRAVMRDCGCHDLGRVLRRRAGRREAERQRGQKGRSARGPGGSRSIHNYSMPS